MSRIDLLLGGDKAATCQIYGDLDGSSTGELNDALEGALESGCVSLTLDFRAADYINSSGIGALVGVLRRARDAGIELRGVGLSDHYRHIFEITRLVEFIDIAGGEDG